MATLKSLMLKRVLVGADLGLKDLIFAVGARFEVTEAEIDDELQKHLKTFSNETALKPEIVMKVLQAFPLFVISQRAKAQVLRRNWISSSSPSARAAAKRRQENSTSITGGLGFRVDNIHMLHQYILAEQQNIQQFQQQLNQSTNSNHNINLLRRRKRVVHMAANVPALLALQLLSLHRKGEDRLPLSGKIAARRVLLFVGKVTFGTGMFLFFYFFWF